MWSMCRHHAWTPVPIPYDSSQFREEEEILCGGHSTLRAFIEKLHITFLDCSLGAHHVEFLRDGEYPADTNFSRRAAWEETLRPDAVGNLHIGAPNARHGQLQQRVWTRAYEACTKPAYPLIHWPTR